MERWLEREQKFKRTMITQEKKGKREWDGNGNRRKEGEETAT